MMKPLGLEVETFEIVKHYFNNFLLVDKVIIQFNLILKNNRFKIVRCVMYKNIFFKPKK